MLSPSTQAVDRCEKLTEYASAGIPEYWMVDLDAEAIDVYTLADGASCDQPPQRYRAGETVRPVVAPDVTVAVADVLGSLPT